MESKRKASNKSNAKAGAKTANKARKAGRGRRRQAQPLAAAYPSKQLRGVTSSVVISGRDIIVSVNVASGTPAGRTLMQLQLNPRLLTGTRLDLQSKAWQMWRPLTMNFHIQGTASSAAAGQLGVAWAADPHEVMPSNTTALLRKIGSFMPNAMIKPWESRTIAVTRAPVQRMLYCDPKAPDSTHGALLLACTATTSGYTGSFGVTVSLDWTVRFESPDMPTADEVEEVVTADSGYFPYFVSSSSHAPFTDRALVYCSTQGGYSNISRFSTALVDTVYEPVTSTQLQYYASDKTTLKNVAALVRMKEVPDPLMWCFDSVKNAAEYIKTGSSAHILQNYKDGPWCEGNPLWKQSASLHVIAPLYTNAVRDLTANKIANHVAQRLDRTPDGTTIDPIKVFAEGDELVADLRRQIAELKLRTGLELLDEACAYPPDVTE
uniref:Structural protein n=1 Tax=Soybean thrips tombus-like virus 7 TaxID=2796564 RepID=A0A7T3R0I8_9TOMB|nr:structural protein precursor [Soybean thrips tombus-like virus 7]